MLPSWSMKWLSHCKPLQLEAARLMIAKHWLNIFDDQCQQHSTLDVEWYGVCIYT